MNRRDLLRDSCGFAALLLSGGSTFALTSEPDAGYSALVPWQPGYLDIHHINTGRGNSALAILPDGTSLLVDAGASGTQGAAMNIARPGSTKRPGQWIARYIERQLAPTGSRSLDYALMTHLHGDHVGDVGAQSPTSSIGDYKLTGISDVAEAIPIARLIDRGFPDYTYPAIASEPAALNYIRYVRSAALRGTNVERVQVGSKSQIALQKQRSHYPEFTCRMVAGNGEVWTGEGERSQSRFPSQAGVGPAQLANENSCSIALRLGYGKFSYFTGGDLNCDTNYGRDPWRDVETPAGKIAGPASVSTCNHHGYFDATGPEFVRAVRPRVWILQSWHASHPAMSVLASLYSPVLYPGPRDVFCLGLNPATALACSRFSDLFKSSQGHVLVRVSPGGSQFSVFVLEDGDEADTVKVVFGPFMS